MCYSRPTATFMCGNSSRSVYSAALWRRKPPILPHFGLRHLVISTVGGNLRKLNTSEQLQTFPYPTVSKSFLYSNAFLAKSGAQTVTFTSVTNRQTKNATFWLKSKPHQTWHRDRGPRACSCTSKIFGGPMHSFAARGH